MIGLGAAGHQAWGANIYTLVSDTMPKKATASVVGIGSMVGAIAGILSDKALGSLLDQAGNTAYFWTFLIAGSLYLVVLGVVHLILVITSYSIHYTKLYEDGEIVFVRGEKCL